MPADCMAIARGTRLTVRHEGFQGRTASSEDHTAGWTRVLGPLGTVDLGRDPDELQPVVREVRVFAGYAGWAAGQLEGELQVGGWFVVDADVGDALASNPGSLWRAVLKRQRGTLSWLANYPDDISTN